MADVYTRTFKHLPAEVQSLPWAEKLSRLRHLEPDRAAGFDLLLDAILDEVWGEHFHGGKRGGLKLATQSKGGAK